MTEPSRLKLWAGAIVMVLLFALVIGALWYWWPDL